MRPKNPNQVSNWKFQLTDPSGVVLTIPNVGSYNTRRLLHIAVLSHIRIFDEVTKGKYTKKTREEAEKWGEDFETYMLRVIDHQLCLTNRAVQCWSDGLGDAIHEQMGKIDGYVKHVPLVIRRKVETAIQKITPSKSKTLKACATCGGTKVFQPYENNLGRAGTLNRWTKKKS